MKRALKSGLTTGAVAVTLMAMSLFGATSANASTVESVASVSAASVSASDVASDDAGVIARAPESPCGGASRVDFWTNFSGGNVHNCTNNTIRVTLKHVVIGSATLYPGSCRSVAPGGTATELNTIATQVLSWGYC